MRELLVDLLAGNARHADAYADRFDDLQDAQLPDAVTVCCSDSRVLQDELWDNDEPGRLFTVANIGNRVVQSTGDERVISGDVLYPVLNTGTDVVLVVGHTGCGAVTAAYDDLTEGVDVPLGIRHCIDHLTPALAAGVERLPAGLDRARAIDHLVEYNVDRQVDHLLESDDVPGHVTVVGVVYDFKDTYEGPRGQVVVVNVDGVRSIDRLRERHRAVDDRFERRWVY